MISLYTVVLKLNSKIKSHNLTFSTTTSNFFTVFFWFFFNLLTFCLVFCILLCHIFCNYSLIYLRLSNLFLNFYSLCGLLRQILIIHIIFRLFIQIYTNFVWVWLTQHSDYALTIKNTLKFKTKTSSGFHRAAEF